MAVNFISGLPNVLVRLSFGSVRSDIPQCHHFGTQNSWSEFRVQIFCQPALPEYFTRSLEGLNSRDPRKLFACSLVVRNISFETKQIAMGLFCQLMDQDKRSAGLPQKLVVGAASAHQRRQF